MSYLGLSTKLPVSERLLRSPRRKAILRSAVTEFLRDGFHRASIEGIAAGAGVAKQTIYSHFSSKAGLIDAIDRECVVWPDALTERWTPSTGQLINVAKWNLLRYIPVKMRGAEDDQEETAQSFASL